MYENVADATVENMTFDVMVKGNKYEIAAENGGPFDINISTFVKIPTEPDSDRWNKNVQIDRRVDE
jgi:hypothetical protein